MFTKLNLNDKQKFVVAIVARIAVPMVAIVVTDAIVKKVANKDN